MGSIFVRAALMYGIAIVISFFVAFMIRGITAMLKLSKKEKKG
jgi:hypothetical protein